MATFNKINDFVEDVFNGVHNLNADALTYALSNTAPGSETPDPSADGNGILANVTEIAYTNASSRVPTGTTVTLSGGTATLNGDNLTLTASGGSVGPFRYVYLYNDTAAGDPLIGYWDYGSSITLADGETIALNVATVLATLT